MDLDIKRSHTAFFENLSFIVIYFEFVSKTLEISPGGSAIYGRSSYNGFLVFLPFFDMFEDEIGYAALMIRCAVFGSLMGT